MKDRTKKKVVEDDERLNKVKIANLQLILILLHV